MRVKTMMLLLAVLAFGACKKEDEARIDCGEATVRWGGDPAADGTGWHLRAEDESGPRFYYPENLPDSLKIDNLRVEVCLYETNRLFLCHCVNPPHYSHITSIRKR